MWDLPWQYLFLDHLCRFLHDDDEKNDGYGYDDNEIKGSESTNECD